MSTDSETARHNSIVQNNQMPDDDVLACDWWITEAGKTAFD